MEHSPPRSKRFAAKAFTAPLSILLLSAGLSAPARGAAPTYAATPVPTLGGTHISGTGINSRGEIVGFSFLPGDATVHAYRWSGGAPVDLNPLGSVLSEAAGINDQGQVIGLYAPNPDTLHAFLQSAAGTTTDLGTLGGSFSTALAINNAGVVTGRSEFAADSGDFHAFRHTAGGAMIDLGTLGGRTSTGTAINAAGEITGGAELSNGAPRVFVHSGGIMRNLNVSGVGTGINSSGQVVGRVNNETSFGYHPFLYSGGVTTVLYPTATGLGTATGINGSGTVVGWQCASEDDGGCFAFVYSGAIAYDLNSRVAPPLAGIQLNAAYAINDAGQIVASGCVGQTCKIYRLDPIAPAGMSIEVPALGPTSLALASALLAAAGGIHVRRRRKLDGSRQA